MQSRAGAPGETAAFVPPRPIAALNRFFASWRFPLVVLALLGSLDLLQLAVLLTPRSLPGLGAFAEEFRVWCYRQDPATGRLDVAYLLMFLLQPALICALVFGVWRRQLGIALFRERRATLPYLAASAAAVALSTWALIGLGSPATAADLAFPAEALRTHKPAPAVALVDQEGHPVELAKLRGHVVVVTGIYATCYHTCPLIMAELRRALDALTPQERSAVRVVAVTLNPEHDTREVLAKTALRYQVQSPEFSLLSGTPSEVERTLDRLEIARSADPMSGQINHANLFILVDREGQVAYRLTLGERQERWLVQALRLLAREPAPGPAT